MPRGFFALSQITNRVAEPRIAQCGACALYKTCKSPKMEPSGKGYKKILIVGEAPGREEDRQGIQFCGQSGQRLESALLSLGIDMRRDCKITNAVICRPPNNETPDHKKIGYCRANLTKTIAEYKPNVIILLGAVAVRSLLSADWKKQISTMTEWTGWQIPLHRLNAWVCPTFHPAFLERQEDPVLDLMFKKHLEAAVELEEKPFNKPPNYQSRVELIFKPSEAAKAIREFKKAKRIAFDYETNMLKPDDERQAEIVCCSISSGMSGKTIAYPWHGDAIEATSRLLRSQVPKLGSNIKFEERWTKAMLGHRVRNWRWDTMNGAHFLDNRTGITSIKFQSLVRLGVSVYDDHIAQFLKAKGGNTPNRIREIDLRALLTYNGLDSLLEYEVAEDQFEEMDDDPTQW